MTRIMPPESQFLLFRPSVLESSHCLRLAQQDDLHLFRYSPILVERRLCPKQKCSVKLHPQPGHKASSPSDCPLLQVLVCGPVSSCISGTPCPRLSTFTGSFPDDLLRGAVWYSISASPALVACLDASLQHLVELVELHEPVQEEPCRASVGNVMGKAGGVIITHCNGPRRGLLDRQCLFGWLELTRFDYLH